LELIQNGHGPLDWKRNALAQDALDVGAGYILWIDSDQQFPASGLMQLLTRKRGLCRGKLRRAIVGPLGRAGYSRQADTARRRDATGRSDRLRLLPDAAEILAKVPKPWFAIDYLPDGGCLGEDVHFCNQARSVGIPVHATMTLTSGTSQTSF
jgi:hypothetical protein